MIDVYVVGGKREENKKSDGTSYETNRSTQRFRRNEKMRIANHIKRGIEKILDKSLRFKSFRDYVNERYNREGFITIPEYILDLEDAYGSYDGFKFQICDQISTVDTVIKSYRFSDIKESDVVLDIGANIGAFSILASKKAKHVFAVEPLYTDILKKNIAINDINNISVLETGLGIGRTCIKFKGRRKIVDSMPLSEILEKVGRCDFLKIDCEGCEWCINCQELEGFRRIEGELHNFDGKHIFSSFGEILTKAGFEYNKLDKKGKLCLLHAKKRI